MLKTDLSRFHGFLVPVFTCFEENEKKSLTVEYIEIYASWLKSKGATGVLVNSLTGEGPVLSKYERQIHAEAWSKACEKHQLIMLLQIGGAPLSDVLELARHADTLNLDGVVCIPELFYKPHDVDQLVGYCKIVAKNCSSHPFLYYHLPNYTDIDFDMLEFCQRAEKSIPNFLGLTYTHWDLNMAVKCLSPKRIIILSDSRMLSNGLLLGFKCFSMATFNMVPDLMQDISGAMQDKNLRRANKSQKRVNALIRDHTSKRKPGYWVRGMKNWFNNEMMASDGASFSAGRARKLY
ncbi:N-acetylneuraminate lyase B-like [Anastrepha obliqua]|uniref:N-acetylneuraminate lyase B-like n=1 Tax=Anastrepha obliqua TaxID=95512 RepID=UPI00240A4438|nr:N-acetylneuraminate lyase B-like [Anastrepha obliqua]